MILKILREMGAIPVIVAKHSRHMDGRSEGGTRLTLLDFFPDDLPEFMLMNHLNMGQ